MIANLEKDVPTVHTWTVHAHQVMYRVSQKEVDLQIVLLGLMTSGELRLLYTI